jgi:hypothetical protein
LEKNNENLLKSKQKMLDQNNTFSPSINSKSRSLTRTVEDLYSWNEKRENLLIAKKQDQSAQFFNRKIPLCPGSAHIVKNLDELVSKCSEKIASIRNFADDSRNTSRIESKYNSLNFMKSVEDNAIEANKIKIKQPKKKTRKIKGTKI